MSQTRFSPNLIAGIILTLLIGIALYLRVYLPYDHVFSGEWIKFTGVDNHTTPLDFLMGWRSIGERCSWGLYHPVVIST